MQRMQEMHSNEKTEGVVAGCWGKRPKVLVCLFPDAERAIVGMRGLRLLWQQSNEPLWLPAQW